MCACGFGSGALFGLGFFVAFALAVLAGSWLGLWMAELPTTLNNRRYEKWCNANPRNKEDPHWFENYNRWKDIPWWRRPNPKTTLTPDPK